MPEIAPLRVLVVDDDPLMLELLTQAVARLGLPTPAQATDGQGALAVVDAAEIDVVLCDIDMPGMDGIELLRHLGSRPSPPAVVLVSGTSDPVLRTVEELGNAHRLQMLGALTKPVRPADLAPLLEQFGDRPSSPGRPTTAAETIDDDELRALLSSCLEVHYQPLYSLSTGEVASLEALARLRRPDGRIVSPMVFVPACERLGITRTLLMGVLHQSLDALNALKAAGFDLRLSLNMSADDLDDTTLADLVEAEARSAGIPLSDITVELTENRIMPETPTPVEILTRLRVRGVELSIDDYGTGFSSLKQLKRVPFTELKIDQTFVRGAYADERLRTIFSSTVELAHQLGLRCVAEGVETAEDLDLVRSLGCDFVQGFYLARPMPVAELLVFLTGSGRPTG